MDSPVKNFCVKCGAEIVSGNIFCPKCGHKVGESVKPETSNDSRNILAVIFIILLTVFIILKINSTGIDFQQIYNENCSSKFAKVASDGSYLHIDTNPEDKERDMNYEAYNAVKKVNQALGLPESVLHRMDSTRAMDGIQTYTADGLEITWTYHPDKGLEVDYTKKK